MLEATLFDRLTAAGVTTTHQRRTVCQVLEASSDHPDAYQIHERARRTDSRIALASVYRILKTLYGLGLVDKHDFGDNRARYEVRPSHPHDHLVDQSSRVVVDFVAPELESFVRGIAAKHGFELQGHRLAIYGRQRSEIDQLNETADT